MKFKLVREVDGIVGVYDGKRGRTGDVFEFTGPFEDKANRNPDFEQVSDDTTTKRRRGRPAKTGKKAK